MFLKKIGYPMLVWAVCVCSVSATGPTEVTTTAQVVLNKLYQAAGQFQLKQPAVKMTTENKKVASYYPAKNLILLDQKAYDLCRTLGKDSLNALAFILGHELSHAFQSEIRSGKTRTNFLSYDHAYKAQISLEKVADLNGVFTAFLAGYRLSAAVPRLLPLLYDAYQLTGATLPGYPSLQERSSAATEVLDITGDLINLYETSSYLIAAGQYEVAAANYAYIQQYYQGREICNNLGVLYLLSALEYYLPQTDAYVYPVELDAATQLKKLEKSRGGYQLPAQEKMLRVRLLEQALASFQQALVLDKNYLTAKLNIVCTLNLLEKPQEALAFLQKNKMLTATKSAAIREKMYLASGITHALLHDQLLAEADFYQVTPSNRQAASIPARFNLDVLHGREMIYLPEHTFELPAQFRLLVKSIPMSRVSQLEPKKLNNDGGFFKKIKEGLHETFTFGNNNGNRVSIVRFHNELAPSVDLPDLAGQLDRSFFYNLVTATDGFYLYDAADGVALKVAADGKVLEMARVIVH